MFFLKENHVFLEFRFSRGDTFSELAAFLKDSIWEPTNLPKWSLKSMKIDLNFHIEIYLRFSSILVVGGILDSDFLRGGVHPTTKDGSSLRPGAGELLPS